MSGPRRRHSWGGRAPGHKTRGAPEMTFRSVWLGAPAACAVARAPPAGAQGLRPANLSEAQRPPGSAEARQGLRPRPGSSRLRLRPHRCHSFVPSVCSDFKDLLSDVLDDCGRWLSPDGRRGAAGRQGHGDALLVFLRDVQAPNTGSLPLLRAAGRRPEARYRFVVNRLLLTMPDGSMWSYGSCESGSPPRTTDGRASTSRLA